MIKIKVQLQESKTLLSEITLEQAKAIVYSNKTTKAIFNMVMQTYGFRDSYDKTVDPPTITKVRNNVTEAEIEKFTHYIQMMIEVTTKNIRDISDEERALSMVWLKNQIKKEDIRSLITSETIFSGDKGRFGVGEVASLKSIAVTLERYFQRKFLLPPELKDLHKIPNVFELRKGLWSIEDKYQEYKDKKERELLDKDTATGTEILNPSKDFNIFVAHNKGAACELGKDTHWCTAAPGLDYFKTYYKPEDPLFIFTSKKNIGSDPSNKNTNKPNFYDEKFQFHFGSKQFMDKTDHPIDRGTVKDMLEQMIQANPDLLEKYQVIEQVYNVLSLDDPDHEEGYAWDDIPY